MCVVTTVMEAKAEYRTQHMVFFSYTYNYNKKKRRKTINILQFQR